jgi:hypothetical protein
MSQKLSPEICRIINKWDKWISEKDINTPELRMFLALSLEKQNTYLKIERSVEESFGRIALSSVRKAVGMCAPLFSRVKLQQDVSNSIPITETAWLLSPNDSTHSEVDLLENRVAHALVHFYVETLSQFLSSDKIFVPTLPLKLTETPGIFLMSIGIGIGTEADNSGV